MVVPALVITGRCRQCAGHRVGRRRPRARWGSQRFRHVIAGTSAAARRSRIPQSIRTAMHKRGKRANSAFRGSFRNYCKHKKLWQEILLASLVIQLIALATPLFTQAIIDKVVVHHTQSTLDRDRHRHGGVHVVLGRPVVAAPIPGAAYREPRRCSIGFLRVRAPVQTAADVFPAPPDRRHRRAPAWGRNHPRIHRQRGGHAGAGLAVPADFRGHHVLLQCDADADRAGDSERDRRSEPASWRRCSRPVCRNNSSSAHATRPF